MTGACAVLLVTTNEGRNNESVNQQSCFFCVCLKEFKVVKAWLDLTTLRDIKCSDLLNVVVIKMIHVQLFYLLKSSLSYK